jgi:hypothetical protein
MALIKHSDMVTDAPSAFGAFLVLKKPLSEKICATDSLLHTHWRFLVDFAVEGFSLVTKPRYVSKSLIYRLTP